MFTVVLYGLAGLLYGVSWYHHRGKTLAALKKSLKVFTNLLPQLLGLFMIVGMLMAIVSPELISQWMGAGSGIWGVLNAAFIGSITLVPGFVAFPLAARLLVEGAGLAQMATFVTALMMVGVATFPLEAKTMGRKAALLRNILALLLSICMAGIVGWILG